MCLIERWLSLQEFHSPSLLLIHKDGFHVLSPHKCICMWTRHMHTCIHFQIGIYMDTPSLYMFTKLFSGPGSASTT
jgi:hypothetical protein